jgi:chaperone required for assembly of F1-ATPase
MVDRRLYKLVDTAAADAGFALRLDGKVARTPGGLALVLPTAALADLVAAEWSAQGEKIAWETMPATRLAHTALDAVPAARDQTAAAVARFASADALCYFADQPRVLAQRQAASWTPLLDWARRELGLEFVAVTGLVHTAQPPATLQRVRRMAAEADDFTLAGLAFGAALFGSAILVLAVRAGRVSAAEAFDLSRIDETFQEERWGVDAEAAARADAMAKEAVTVGRWFAAL